MRLAAQHLLNGVDANVALIALALHHDVPPHGIGAHDVPGSGRQS